MPPIDPQADLGSAANNLAPAPPRDRATDGRLRTQAGDLPEELSRRFLAEPARFGGHVDYFVSPGARRPAFRDRGDRLSTTANDPATLAALLAIADHRGWKRLRVQGDDDFRREIWRLAYARGIEVEGYKPTARDRAAVAREVRNQARDASRDATGPGARAAGVSGVLREIGLAPFQDRADTRPSPLVRLAPAAGPDLRLWGAGIPKALAKAGAQVGDQVTLRQAPHAGQDTPPGRGRRQATWIAEVARDRAPPDHAPAPAPPPLDPIVKGRLSVIEAVARSLLPDPEAVARVLAAAQARMASHLAAGRRFDRPGPQAEPDRRPDRAPPRGPERTRR